MSTRVSTCRIFMRIPHCTARLIIRTGTLSFLYHKPDYVWNHVLPALLTIIVNKIIIGSSGGARMRRTVVSAIKLPESSVFIP